MKKFAGERTGLDRSGADITFMVMNWSSWVVIGIGAAMALAGLALAAWGLFGDPRRGRKRCRKCWYELSPDAGASTRCPECGFIAQTDRDCTRTKRRWWVAATGLILAIVGIAPAMGTERARRLALLVLPTWKVTTRHVLGPYTVLEMEAQDALAIPPRMVEVRENGAVVWRLRTFYPEVGGRALGANGQIQIVGLGTDVTGDGKPDLIIADPSPGSGGFSNQFVFTLDAGTEGPTLMPLAVIPSSGLWQKQLGEAAWQFAAGDRTFAYWWTTGAGSPHPVVVLGWKGDHYGVDAAAMRKPAPSAAEIAVWAEADRAGAVLLGTDWRSPVLTRALDLIYSGNAAAAWEYLRQVWPPTADITAEAAITQIRERLDESPFAADILRMQK